jgi:hypothetical protein
MADASADTGPGGRLTPALLCRIFGLTRRSLSTMLVCKEWLAAAPDTPAWWRELHFGRWLYVPCQSYQYGPGEMLLLTNETQLPAGCGPALLRGIARVGRHVRKLKADTRQLASLPLPLPRLLGAARASCPHLESQPGFL